jgi:hypothetical protein
MTARDNRDRPLPEGQRPRVQDATIQRALDALATPVIAIVKFLQPFVQAQKWQPLTFSTGWSQYSDPDLSRAGYRKNPLGRVELRGTVARTSGSTTTIAVLPVGYRPAHRTLFPAAGSSGAGVVSVYSTGVVEYTSGGVTYFSLEGITFDTES